MCVYVCVRVCVLTQPLVRLIEPLLAYTHWVNRETSVSHLVSRVCVCVCACSCVCACMCVCVCACVKYGNNRTTPELINMYTNTHIHTHIHTHSHTHIYIYIHFGGSLNTTGYSPMEHNNFIQKAGRGPFTDTHTQTHMHTCAHTYIHTYTHTHIHIHIRIQQ